jgi:hypothetical protein
MIFDEKETLSSFYLIEMAILEILNNNMLFKIIGK